MFICCKDDNDYKTKPFTSNINVKFMNFEVIDGEVFYLQKILPNRSYVVIDSAKSKNNTIRFNTYSKEDFLGIISRKKNFYSATITVTNDSIQLDWYDWEKSKIRSKVKGGETDFYQKNQLRYIYPYSTFIEVNLEIAKYGKVPENNSNYDYWVKYEKQFCNWVNDNTDKFYTLMKLYDNRINLSTKNLENCLMALKDNFEKHTVYIEIVSYLKTRETSKIGNKLIDFEVQDKNQKTIKSNLIFEPKKEIYIIDFGASWCKYCIIQAREMNVNYSKIDTSKIQIISLSIDENKENWLKYEAKEQYNWKSYLLHNISSNPMKKLIETIPYYIVLDKDKKIIGKYNSLYEIPHLKIKPNNLVKTKI